MSETKYTYGGFKFVGAKQKFLRPAKPRNKTTDLPPEQALAEDIRKPLRPEHILWYAEQRRQIEEAQRAQRQIEFGEKIGRFLRHIFITPILIVWTIVRVIYAIIAFLFTHSEALMYLFIWALTIVTVGFLIFLYFQI